MNSDKDVVEFRNSIKKTVQQQLDYVTKMPLPSEDEYTLSMYLTGHDRVVVIAKGRDVLEVIEVERLVNLKNADFEIIKVAKNYPTNTYEHATPDLYEFYMSAIFDYVKQKYPNVTFNTCFTTRINQNISNFFKCSNYVYAHHHCSHAFSAFYQSPYRQALAITYDGGSPDHITTGVFLMNRQSRCDVIQLFKTDTIVGRYQDIGLLFECLEWQPAKAAHTLPGKIMALASFGTPNRELLPYYKSVVSGNFQNNFPELKERYLKEFDPDDYYISKKIKEMMDQNVYSTEPGSGFTKEQTTNLFYYLCQRLFIINAMLEKEGIENSKELAPLAMAFYGINYLKFFSAYDESYYKSIKRIPDEKAFNMAATLQLACEELWFEKINPYLKMYPNLPIVLAGGGALNIILNTRIKKETGRPVSVGPDPSDCGLALGAMLGYLRPSRPYDNPYSGLPILDYDNFSAVVMDHLGVNSDLSKYNIVNNVKANLNKVAKLIVEGKIFGVIRGRSERGPRALGNRSIICSASIPGIKDKLNAKVKFREWFRPFAPIVRLEDVSKYFDWEGESRYMNFCIDVKEEYKEKLQAITHVDGTARVQTITDKQNQFIYRLLTELDGLTGVGVIVNTSFNVNGRPLINSVKDAFYLLENTELDGIIVEDTLIYKK